MKIRLRKYNESKNTFEKIVINCSGIYTGYKDKNGKRIYTGDIIGFEEVDLNEGFYGKYTGIVTKNRDYVYVDLINNIEQIYSDFTLENIIEPIIIGNIMQDVDIVEALRFNK